MSSAPYLDADVIKRIANITPSLPGAQRRLALYVLDNAFEVASSSIESLAEATGVSIATANRFAVALGYSGYAEFRQALFQIFKPSLEPIEKLRQKLDRGSNPAEVVHESVSSAAHALEQTSNQITPLDVERAISILASARNVFCLGLGTSGYLADIAAFRFAPYCQHIHALASHGGAEMALYHLQKIDTQDVLLTISFPRYSADILRIMRFAKERGATNLSITDRPSSPLMSLADHTLFVPAEHQILSGSLVPALALIEGMTAAMAHRNPETLEMAEELTRQLVPYFYVDKETASRDSIGRTPVTSTRKSKKKE
ncbi:MurR/RpiR family transcriptional regulator [Achromobacter sp. F4_2707]|uniref:MurR/RpiR family transcriptional regulator n=1 Tax=Achromobacter sp. F4_2707 TaxID=3114286 RepID=UPI0039C745BE